jgi:hypothetical protein
LIRTRLIHHLPDQMQPSRKRGLPQMIYNMIL